MPRLLLAVLLCTALSLPLAAAAADPAATPAQRIADAAQALQAVRRSLDDAESSDTLVTLAERAQAAQRGADAAVAELEPQLAQLDARLTPLGEASDGEDAAIAAQRRALQQQRGELDTAVRQGRLLAEEARQLAEGIEKTRVAQFGAQLSRRLASPLSPALWRQFAAQLPEDLRRLAGLYELGAQGIARGVAAHGWTIPVACGSLALLLALPLRIWLRRLGRRYAASAHAPAGRLRRSGLAVWLLLVGTLLPGLAVLLVVQGLRWIEAIPPRLQTVADTVVTAGFVSAFIAALAACLLVPSRPSWRMLDIDDIAAARLRRYAWVAAGLTWITMLLRAISRAARTSEVSSITLDGLIALTYVGLIMAMLVTLSRLHQRREALAVAQLAADAEANADAPKLAAAARSGWIVLGRLGGHLSVVVALLATLLGYLNFAMFISQQMVWVTVVVSAVLLLLKFADDLVLWLLAPEAMLGRTLRLSIGLGKGTVEQTAVLLSALLRVTLVLLGLMALSAPFGNLNVFLGGLQPLLDGIPIGDTVLRPGVVLRALLVLGIGLALNRVFQHWLADTYLPKTQLGAGSRNSIATVARYLGLILAGLWALAALGIGFEKLALVASALSVGIGFGLQAITQNFVSGLILLAERPVKIGDWVKIGDQEGDIRRINVRSTEIQVGDKSTLIVPNSELITKTIRNMTKGSAQGRVQLKFAVPLSTDVVALREAMLQAYAAHPQVLESPAPVVYIDGIESGQIVINSYCHVPSPRNAYAARSELLFDLLPRLAALGIALSSPTDIHLVTPDPADAPPP